MKILTNYMEIQNWMRGLGFPETLQQIYDWQINTEMFEQPYKIGYEFIL
jgi:hypothetical protein